VLLIWLPTMVAGPADVAAVYTPSNNTTSRAAVVLVPIGVNTAPPATPLIWLLPYRVILAPGAVVALEIAAAIQYSPGVTLTFMGTVSWRIPLTPVSEVLLTLLAACHEKALLVLPEEASESVEPFKVYRPIHNDIFAEPVAFPVDVPTDIEPPILAAEPLT